MEVDPLAADAKTPDHERIQGKWRSVQIETLGYPPTEHTRSLMLFAGDRVTTADGTIFRFRLDPSAQPKQLDLLHADTEDARYYGIYAFEGDQLVTCFTYLPPRPAGFSTSKDVSNLLTYYEREDDGPPPGGQADAAADGGT